MCVRPAADRQSRIHAAPPHLKPHPHRIVRGDVRCLGQCLSRSLLSRSPLAQALVSTPHALSTGPRTAFPLSLTLTVNSPRNPAFCTTLRAAISALGYTPACTERMHTAMGTLTTLLPTAAMAPAMKATVPVGCDKGQRRAQEVNRTRRTRRSGGYREGGGNTGFTFWGSRKDHGALPAVPSSLGLSSEARAGVASSRTPAYCIPTLPFPPRSLEFTRTPPVQRLTLRQVRAFPQQLLAGGVEGEEGADDDARAAGSARHALHTGSGTHTRETGSMARGARDTDARAPVVCGCSGRAMPLTAQARPLGVLTPVCVCIRRAPRTTPLRTSRATRSTMGPPTRAAPPPATPCTGFLAPSPPPPRLSRAPATVVAAAAGSWRQLPRSRGAASRLLGRPAWLRQQQLRSHLHQGRGRAWRGLGCGWGAVAQQATAARVRGTDLERQKWSTASAAAIH